MTTLIFFSGGLDSTALLVRMLRTTEEPIHVHFIELKTNDNRFTAELAAVNKILPVIHDHNRYFHTSRSVLDFLQIGRRHIFDQHTVRYIGAQFARANPHIKTLMWGKCKDDEAGDHFQRIDQANKIFDACMDGYPKPEWKAPNASWTKKEEIAYLQSEMPELLSMIHYCRFPIEAQWNCEQCRTCKLMKEADSEVFQRKVKR